MEFTRAYDKFMSQHRVVRVGDTSDEIRDEILHAEKLFLEKVWWPAFHTFDGLHPEYQVRDFKEGYRYIDFAYIQPNFRIAIEIDGFGPHWRDITPDKFTDHLIRQNHLIIDGWKVLRFSFGAISHHSRVCQQTIQQLIGRLTGERNMLGTNLSVVQREIVLLAIILNRTITTTDVMKRCQVSRPTARRHLKLLTDLQWLQPTSNPERVHGYRLHPTRSSIQL